MRLRSSTQRRSGITLLEVLAATALFLMSLVAIGELMSTSADQAMEVNFQSKGMRLCQSKLNEFIAGVESVSTGGSGTFDEEPAWSWQAECTADSTAVNLYKVKVTVSRDYFRGKIEVSLSQYIFDPAQKGQLADSSSSSGTTGTTTAGSSP